MTRPRAIAFAVMIGTAAAIAVPLATPAAQAYPICKADYQCTDTFYSNAQYTTVVGNTTHFCNGTSSTVGEITPYVRVTQVACG